MAFGNIGLSEIHNVSSALNERVDEDCKICFTAFYTDAEIEETSVHIFAFGDINSN